MAGYSTQGFTPQKRQKVWEKTQGRCWYCGIETIRVGYEAMQDAACEQGRIFCIDHVDPWLHGGGHGLDNLVPACKHCNSRKRARSLEGYRLWCARQGLPEFTADHIAYLQQIGVMLPPDFPCYPTVTFWFEQEKRGSP